MDIGKWLKNKDLKSVGVNVGVNVGVKQRLHSSLGYHTSLEMEIE